MEESLEIEKIKSAIESLIFISHKPLTIDELKSLFEDVDPEKLRALIDTLKKEHEDRNSGVRIAEIAGGFQMVTSPDNATVIKEFYKIKSTEKLSGPSLETLAIIAYKQPVTRVDIEAIRGVNCDGVVRSLLEKNLIRVVGRKEVIGRPFVYGSTRMFLDYFGLKSLEELPRIEEFAQQDKIMDMALVSGDAQITPLTKEEEEKFQEDQKRQNETQAPLKEAADEPQQNP
jgi:segregation and condensation protein B